MFSSTGLEQAFLLLIRRVYWTLESYPRPHQSLNGKKQNSNKLLNVPLWA